MILIVVMQAGVTEVRRSRVIKILGVDQRTEGGVGRYRHRIRTGNRKIRTQNIDNKIQDRQDKRIVKVRIVIVKAIRESKETIVSTREMIQKTSLQEIRKHNLSLPMIVVLASQI